MKVDLDFYKLFFAAFLESEKASITYKDLIESGVEVYSEGKLSEKFLFHMERCIDNNFIKNEKGECYNLKSFGITSPNCNDRIIISVAIILTEKGDNFAKALNNKDVFKKLKAEFKDMPIKTIFDGSQKLLQHLAKKKMDDFLDE